MKSICQKKTEWKKAPSFILFALFELFGPQNFWLTIAMKIMHNS